MSTRIKCHARAPRGSATTGSGFRHNFSKKLSPGPKNGRENGRERRPLQFSTIYTKNQVLKLNIDKVMLIITAGK
jgi:hypothetical protein